MESGTLIYSTANTVMEIINAFRSIPFGSTDYSVGGTVWACEVCNDSRIDAMYPSGVWIEMEVIVLKRGAYVTSEDGGTTAFGEEDGWYSFPATHVIRWRFVGEEKWKAGRGYKKYSNYAFKYNESKKHDSLQTKKLYEKYNFDDSLLPPLID